MDDLLAMFLPKFSAIAKTRIAKSLDLVNQRTPDYVPTIARELHAIAGEAGLLGLVSIVALARNGEEHVKRLRASHSDADVDALLTSLTALKSAIDEVSIR
jgi:HPt (histidine-containing phosphotransfer) domain-containing protein